jgi:hypothetical protein
MTNLDFVPETLDWCQRHYVPPVKKYISCDEFGKPDGMNGSCHWCLEMFPYQWEMCQDESWIRGLLSKISRVSVKSREEAIEYIENYKQGHVSDGVNSEV